MKESIYNIYFTAEDGTRLVFNSFSCGLAIIDERYDKLLAMLDCIKELVLPDSLKEVLKSARQGHFFIDDDYDEVLDYTTRQRIQRYNTNQLGLTIAPTLSCNFKCIYCYETAKKGVMSQATQDAIVAFIKKQAEQLQDIKITWYGGEPVLALDVIQSLSEKIICICKSKNIPYRSYIVTNGSLLDNDKIDVLQKCKIAGVQISVDGPQKVHDSRRISKNGQSTFDTVIKNINRLIDKNFDVSIRINVDKENESYISELIQYFSSHLISKNVRISFGQVAPYTDACKTIESACFDNITFAKKRVQYYQILERNGFGISNPFPYPITKFNYCCADMLNNFVVDPQGYLYKCWNDVGNISVSVGNINDENFDICNCKNGKQICHLDPMPKKCKSCNVLPICAGGCSHLKKNIDDCVCSLDKYNIIDVMRIYYEKNKLYKSKK